MKIRCSKHYTIALLHYYFIYMWSEHRFTSADRLTFMIILHRNIISEEYSWECWFRLIRAAALYLLRAASRCRCRRSNDPLVLRCRRWESAASSRLIAQFTGFLQRLTLIEPLTPRRHRTNDFCSPAAFHSASVFLNVKLNAILPHQFTFVHLKIADHFRASTLIKQTCEWQKISAEIK